MKPQYMPKTTEARLGYLVEECGEVLAAIDKAQRWGLESFNPELPNVDESLKSGGRETNRAWILREVADLELAIALLKADLAHADAPSAAPVDNFACTYRAGCVRPRGHVPGGCIVPPSPFPPAGAEEDEAAALVPVVTGPRGGFLLDEKDRYKAEGARLCKYCSWWGEDRRGECCRKCHRIPLPSVPAPVAAPPPESGTGERVPPEAGDVWRHRSGGDELYAVGSVNTLDGKDRVWKLAIGRLHDGFKDSTSFYESAFTDGTLVFVRRASTTGTGK